MYGLVILGEAFYSVVVWTASLNITKCTLATLQHCRVHLNGLTGWFVWSVPAVSEFAGDPTSLAHDNIFHTNLSVC